MKYESEYEKLKKKRRTEKLIQSQHGALDTFFSSKKDFTSYSIKDHKLDVDFENELGMMLMLKNKSKMKEMILKIN